MNFSGYAEQILCATERTRISIPECRQLSRMFGGYYENLHAKSSYFAVCFFSGKCWSFNSFGNVLLLFFIQKCPFRRLYQLSYFRPIQYRLSSSALSEAFPIAMKSLVPGTPHPFKIRFLLNVVTTVSWKWNLNFLRFKFKN
jgi:hypothetical protein